MAYRILIREYFQIPPLTRAYTTACFLTSLAVQLDIVSPFRLYFHPTLIMEKLQLWRLITPFFYFGNLSLNYVFSMLFTYRCCRMLEEESFRGRPADFLYMIIFGCVIAIFFASFLLLPFLGQSLTTMFVYIWARRNPYVQMGFFGLFVFRAPYLPWVMVALSVLFHDDLETELIGILIGHAYFYFEDVFPYVPGGWRLLATPRIFKLLFDGELENSDYHPPAEEHPAGLHFGAQEEQANQQRNEEN